MSSNLPLVFEHFKYGNSNYIDGGTANNFAIDLAVEKGGKNILGIYIEMSNNYSLTKNNEFNVLEYIFKIIFIPTTEIRNLKFKSIEKNNNHKMDIIKIVDIKNTNPFNFGISVKDRLDLFSNGYQSAKQYYEKNTNVVLEE
jgi:predicted patatin/cPLA2 family phospholipase